jgi:ketosteroid isomerase-like protein
MSAPATDITALAGRLSEAICKPDFDALHQIYAPDAVIWHCTDRLEQTVDQSAAVLGWLHKNTSGFRFDDIRVQPTPSGYVQQHVLRAATASGAEIAAHACLVVTVTEGRIARLEEYIDSAAFAALAP